MQRGRPTFPKRNRNTEWKFEQDAHAQTLTTASVSGSPLFDPSAPNRSGMSERSLVGGSGIVEFATGPTSSVSHFASTAAISDRTRRLLTFVSLLHLTVFSILNCYPPQVSIFSASRPIMSPPNKSLQQSRNPTSTNGDGIGALLPFSRTCGGSTSEKSRLERHLAFVRASSR